MKDRVDPLAVVRVFLENHPVSDYPRDFLLTFAKRHFSYKDSDLVTDCLIAAGIGRFAEQTGTVWTSASYD